MDWSFKDGKPKSVHIRTLTQAATMRDIDKHFFCHVFRGVFALCRKLQSSSVKPKQPPGQRFWAAWAGNNLHFSLPCKCGRQRPLPGQVHLYVFGFARHGLKVAFVVISFLRHSRQVKRLSRFFAWCNMSTSNFRWPLDSSHKQQVYDVTSLGEKPVFWHSKQIKARLYLWAFSNTFLSKNLYFPEPTRCNRTYLLLAFAAPDVFFSCILLMVSGRSSHTSSVPVVHKSHRHVVPCLYLNSLCAGMRGKPV